MTELVSMCSHSWYLLFNDKLVPHPTLHLSFYIGTRKRNDSVVSISSNSALDLPVTDAPRHILLVRFKWESVGVKYSLNVSFLRNLRVLVLFCFVHYISPVSVIHHLRCLETAPPFTNDSFDQVFFFCFRLRGKTPSWSLQQRRYSDTRMAFSIPTLNHTESPHATGGAGHIHALR